MGNYTVSILMTLFVLFIRVLPLIAVFAVVFYFVNKDKKKKEVMEQKGLSHEYIIKYDITDRKIYLTILAVSGVGAVILASIIDAKMSQAMMVIFFGLFGIMTGVAVYSLFNYISASAYLHELKKQGYQLPEHMEDYNYSVEELLREGQVDENSETEGEPARDPGALRYTVVAIIIYAAVSVYNVVFSRVNYNMGSTAVEAMKLMFIFDIFWLVVVSFFWIQSNNLKYKNKTQVIKGRKNRFSAVEAILFFIICILITLFVKSSVYSLSKFIVKSNMSVNAQYEDALRSAFDRAYEKSVNGEFVIPDDVMEELEEGTNILTWDNDCDFKNDILKTVGADSFTNLKSRIKNPDGEPKIVVIYQDEKFSVEFENVFSII